ncbi:MAG: amidohydrolase [Acidobacteriota bacterium]|nr:amidohydrolase [Acidobacteriota bacterium]
MRSLVMNLSFDRRAVKVFLACVFVAVLGPERSTAQPRQTGPAAPSAAAPSSAAPSSAASARLVKLKAEAASDVDGMKDFTQQMVDQVFSFGELAFQEVETTKYLTSILEKNGFTIERDYAGIPTAWVATWGSGKPVIAIGSDIDCIPQASQKPGVAYHEPILPGAPGHGEGHNSGVPLNITAALAVKKIMERERLPGTLKLWPGVAEEVLGAKAYFIRAGLFRDVDISLFSHVAASFDTSWGAPAGTGLQSVEYTFKGESAHAASNPWRGRSALDAVALMDIAWNFRREHLRLQQRSHSVITDGGDQPNVVPSTASVWYFLRETDYAHILEMRAAADRIAKAAASMTETQVSWRLLGSAWPRNMSRPLAEVVHANVMSVGMPKWDEADERLARALQRELKQPEVGLASDAPTLKPGLTPEENYGGGTDDIGDVSWTVPTVTLNYPANIPNLPGHNWANAVAMATPIAHKGTTAGAKVQAMTILDFLIRPELVRQAREYFDTHTTRDQKYQPFIGPDDKPAIHLNTKIDAQYRPAMQKYYFDPAKYKTYLEQLGITYPTVR